MKLTELQSNMLKKVVATALSEVKHNPKYIPLILNLQQHSELLCRIGYVNCEKVSGADLKDYEHAENLPKSRVFEISALKL